MAKPPEVPKLSPSQLAAKQRPVGPQNDMSTWKQVVVGGDDFAPAPAPLDSGGGAKWWLVGLLALLVLGAGGFAVYWFVFTSKPIVTVRSPDAAAPADAALADAALADAVPVDAVAGDAAPAPTVAPKPKPVVKKKKPAVKKKKPVVKKKKPIKRRR